jgi:ABC-2 type transport system permease protein
MVITRSIFLKGVGMEVLWTQMLPLIAMGIAVITLSALRFRKQLA